MIEASTEPFRQGLEQLADEWEKDPARFVETSFEKDPEGNTVVVDATQRRILEAVATHDRVAVRTGRGVGKTAAASWLALNWLGTKFPATVVLSAGSWPHLEDRLWPELRQWGLRWHLKDAFHFQHMRVFSKWDDAKDKLRIVSTSSDKDVNVEGFHSPNLLFIIDEAKGMPDEIFNAIIGSLTSEGRVQKVAAFSTPPLTNTGWFARACSSSDWHTVHISGLESPRVSRAWVDEIVNTFGKESAQYESYVTGQIPTVGLQVVISSQLFEKAQARGRVVDKRHPVVTCDVAREGDDLTTIGLIKESKFGLFPFEDDALGPASRGWFAGSDTMKTVGWVTRACKTAKAKYCVIDDSGLGGGVTDRLRELQSRGEFPSDCTIVPVQFGSQAFRNDRFFNRKSEMWWEAREALREGYISLPTDNEIAAYQLPKTSDFKRQLTAPIHDEDSHSRIRVYDKRTGGHEKAKTLPAKSPDLAHALILGVRSFLSMAPDESLPAAESTEELFRRRLAGLMQPDAAAQGSTGFNNSPYRR